MASTYTDSLRIEKIESGAQSGSWGTTTNTQYDLWEATISGTSTVAFASDGNDTLTTANGSADEARHMFINLTGGTSLTATRNLVVPTKSKLYFVRNNTNGSQSVVVKTTSGSGITVPHGKYMCLYCDGTNVIDATNYQTSMTLGTATIGTGVAEDTKIVYDGNAKDFYVGLDDSADKLVVGVGSTVGTNSILTLDDDSVTVGDGAAVDTKVVFDGNAQDYYIGLDDSADDLVIGLGSTVGTTPAISIDENQAVVFPAAKATIGDGTAEDTLLVYDGNAKDFYVGLDDSADKLVVGVGSTVGTNSILTLDDDSMTVGDGAAVDTKIVFDGNAQDYYIGLDDSADDLVIGLGSAVGTTPAISVDENQMTTFGKAAIPATLTDTSNTGSITLDFNAYQNFILTFTGNVTLANPSTESVGQSGVIVIIQDGTGSRTLTLGTDYETPAGGGLTISTAASAVDVLPYFVKASGSIQLGAPQLAFS